MNQNLRTPKVAMNNPPLNTPQSFNVWKALASIVLAMGLAQSPVHAQQTVSSGNTVNPTAISTTVTGQGNQVSGQNDLVVQGSNNTVSAPNNADVMGDSNIVDQGSPLTVVAGDNNSVTYTGIATMPPGVSSNSSILGGDNVLLGHQSSIDGSSSQLIGDLSTSTGIGNVGVGSNINIFANSATCLGMSTVCGSNQPNSNISTQVAGSQTAIGAFANATGSNTVSVGATSTASAMFGSAFGYGANADFYNCIALGSTCDRANSVSFGNRQLTQLAYGTSQYDGVAVGQLYGFASSFGGGSSFNNGTLVPPSYLLGGNNFWNVGDALQYLYSLDGQQSTGGTGTVSGGQNIVTSTNGSNNTTVSTSPAPTFNTVTTKDAQGNTTVQNGSGVTVTSANGNQVSLTTTGLNNGGNVISEVGAGQVSAGSTQAVNGSQLYQVQQDSLQYNSNTQSYDATRSGSATRISGVAPGVNPTDAINKGQLDSAIGGVKNWAQSYANDKFNSLGAMTAATANAAASFSGVDTNKKNLVAVGFGEQGGRVADAIMYQHRNANGHSAWNASVSFSPTHGGTSIGVGYAMGW